MTDLMHVTGNGQVAELLQSYGELGGSTPPPSWSHSVAVMQSKELETAGFV